MRQRTSVCTSCERTLDPDDWSMLPLVRQLHPDELRDTVSKWPWPDAHLEVRQCRCGATVTKLVIAARA